MDILASTYWDEFLIVTVLQSIAVKIFYDLVSHL